MSSENFISAESASSRQSVLLESLGVGPDVRLGCDIPPFVYVRCQGQAELIQTVHVRGGEKFRQMAFEYLRASREQYINLIGYRILEGLKEPIGFYEDLPSSNRRWTDWLQKDDLLSQKAHQEVSMGINLSRAAFNGAPLRHDNPSDFKMNSEAIRTILNAKAKRYLLQAVPHAQLIAGRQTDFAAEKSFLHDLNNILCPLHMHLDLAISHLGQSAPVPLFKAYNSLASLSQAIQTATVDTSNHQSFVKIFNSGLLALKRSFFALPNFNSPTTYSMEDLNACIERLFEMIEGNQIEPLNSQDLINRVHEIARAHVPEGDVDFDLNQETEQPFVLIAKKSDLSRVFENLIKNSVYALRNVRTCPKRIQITFRFVDPSEFLLLQQDRNCEFLDYLFAAHRRHPITEILEVKIKDTGAGIPNSIQHKIWEPHFSTKGVAGQGQGLPSVQNIIRGHLGNIALEKNVRHGASFSILLPALRC